MVLALVKHLSFLWLPRQEGSVVTARCSRVTEQTASTRRGPSASGPGGGAAVRSCRWRPFVLRCRKELRLLTQENITAAETREAAAGTSGFAARLAPPPRTHPKPVTGSPYFYAPFRATAGEGKSGDCPTESGRVSLREARRVAGLGASGPHGRASRRCGGQPRRRHSAEGSEPRFQFVPAGPSCWEPRADPLSGRGRRARGGGRPAPGRRQVTESGAPAPRRQSCEPELGGSLAGRLGAAAPPGGR